MEESALKEERKFDGIIYEECPNCGQRSFIVCGRCRAGDKFELVDEHLQPLHLEDKRTSPKTFGAECHCGNIVKFINCECDRKISADRFYYNHSLEKADKRDGVAKKVLSEREISRDKEDDDGRKMVRASIVCAISGFICYWALNNHYSLIALPTWWLFITSGIYSVFRLIIWLWRG